MQGLMQEMPLTLGGIFRRAETLWPTKQLVTAGPAGLERTTYRRLGRTGPGASAAPWTTSGFHPKVG